MLLGYDGWIKERDANPAICLVRAQLKKQFLTAFERRDYTRAVF
jgi:hypothetical protein